MGLAAVKVVVSDKLGGIRVEPGQHLTDRNHSITILGQKQ